MHLKVSKLISNNFFYRPVQTLKTKVWNIHGHMMLQVFHHVNNKLTHGVSNAGTSAAFKEMDSDIRIFWVEGLQKKGILTFFLFFDQVWKMVVHMFTDIWIVDIHFTQGKFWRNKLFCQYHKQIYFSYDFIL